MNSFKLRIGVTLLSLLSLGLSGLEVQAAGPAVVNQSMLQAHSAVTEASLGWHRGWGWGGGRFGGWGGPRFGGWGGWGNRGWGGWGFGGFRSYGFVNPGWGYGGFAYARPVIYTYPAYSYPVYYSTPSYYYSPSYCCGYSYVSPYQSSYYCASNNSTPISYSVASYDYPSQPVAYSSNTVSNTGGYSSPSSVGSAYVAKTFRGQSANTVVSSTSGNHSNTAIYTPRKQSVAMASNLAIYRTASQTSNRTPVAPLPNPPVAYQNSGTRQETVRARVATAPKSKLHAEYMAASSKVESKEKLANSSPEKSTVYSGVNVASYTPGNLNSYSAVTRLASTNNLE